MRSRRATGSMTRSMIVTMCLGGAALAAAAGPTACTTHNTTIVQGADSGAEDVPDQEPVPDEPDASSPAACTIAIGGPTAAPSATCSACFTSKCTTKCSACSGNTACKQAASCMKSCGTDADCFEECRRGLPAATLKMLNDAVDPTTGCAAIQCGSQCYANAGIGDPCLLDSDCPVGGCFYAPSVPRPGFGICNGGAGNCNVNEDCRSSASSITNRDGKLVFCWEGYHCFPQCDTDDDCKRFTNYRCATGGAGAGVKVCRPGG